MRTWKTALFLALLAPCLAAGMAACNTDDTPPSTESTDDVTTEDISLTGMDLSGYALIVPRKSTDKESAIMTALYQSASKAKFGMGNDNFDAEDQEILIGATTRAESVQIIEAVSALDDENAFHYALAVLNGKLVLYADDPLGYDYISDRINRNFIKDGILYVPDDLYEIVTVTMEEYEQSELYATALAQAEEDQKRQEERERAIEEAAAAQRAARLERVKTQLAEFTADFGEIMEFPAANVELTVYPTEGQHPRVLFNDTTMQQIRENISAEENKTAYEKMLAYSDRGISDSVRPEVDPAEEHNWSSDVAFSIEAKAFRYALTGDELYGYEAILALKNFISTVNVSEEAMGVTNIYYYGHVMLLSSFVYDWCNDLLTPEDKEQIVAGNINLIATQLELGVPPSGLGSLVGHGCGPQLFQNWLPLAIAIADDYPDIYEYVAGRVFENFVDGQNYFLESGAHHQGNAYGMSRYESMVIAQLLFNRMTDENLLIFNDGILDEALTFIHYIRPDGQGLRIGDDFYEYGTSYYSASGVRMCAMYAFAIYGDPYLKGYYKETTNDFTTGFSTGTSGISAVRFLILNDPSIEAKSTSDLPLVNYNGSPTGAITARSAWNDPDAVMTYMKIGEAYSANHEHKDAGSFQIFYKGILASDSGSYFWYGSDHDYAYHKQTISSNSLLIYNPNMPSYGKWIYSGGQTLTTRGEIRTLDQFLASSASHQAKILGHDYEVDGDKYKFSYLAGDLTNAYDAETVDEVSRYMLSVMTDDENYPMVFVTYDRITSDDASYKKTALIHIQQEPTLTDDGFAIITNTKNGNSGKMVVQSLATPVDYTVLGGEGQEYMVNGVNVANEYETRVEGGIGEFGWGRIEISPQTESKTDRLLTVMYVTDAKNDAAPIRADEIDTAELSGAVIFQKAMLFTKDTDPLHTAATFTVSGDGTLDYYIAGVAAGDWNISVNGSSTFTVTVNEESGLLRFTAAAGEIRITPAK